MKIVPSIIFLITIGRAMSQDQNVFSNHADKDSVVICLREYGLKEVPKDIGQLTKAIALVISPDPLSCKARSRTHITWPHMQPTSKASQRVYSV